MTTEIAILNKEAIALAADSAITISGKGEKKSFHIANKIFALSKYNPVGVMIYGSASFMGIPWETIIKSYRETLSDKKFDFLNDYAQDFLKFFNKKNIIISRLNQEKYVEANIYISYLSIRNRIRERIKDRLKKGDISEKDLDKEIRKIRNDVINRDYKNWTDAKLLPSIPNNHIQKIKEKYKSKSKKIERKVFEKFPLTKTQSEKLLEIVGCRFFNKTFFVNKICQFGI